MIIGPDVSNHQGSVAWGSVASSGGNFAFAKATEGNYYEDPTFAANWAAMKEAGIVRGAYHFARPNDTAPEVQASYFVGWVNQHGGFVSGDYAVLDIEIGSGNLGAWSLSFLQEVRRLAPQATPMLYSYESFLTNRANGFTSATGLGQFPLWAAAYSLLPPAIPAPWRGWTFWQYTDAGAFNGISGSCDVSQFTGTLQQLLGISTSPTPTGAEGRMSITAGAGAQRLDATVVGRDGGVWHSFADSAQGLLSAGWENLGGLAKAVWTTWTHDETEFVVAAHGMDDRMWLRVYSVATQAWGPWQPVTTGLLGAVAEEAEEGAAPPPPDPVVSAFVDAGTPENKPASGNWGPWSS